MKSLILILVTCYSINGFCQVSFLDTVSGSTFEIDTLKIKGIITMKTMILDSIRKGVYCYDYEYAINIIEHSMGEGSTWTDEIDGEEVKYIRYFTKEYDTMTGEVKSTWELRFIIDSKGDLKYDGIREVFDITIYSDF
jgi:hypothetical protein